VCCIGRGIAMEPRGGGLGLPAWYWPVIR
jgi:hypothetical protein